MKGLIKIDCYFHWENLIEAGEDITLNFMGKLSWEILGLFPNCEYDHTLLGFLSWTWILHTGLVSNMLIKAYLHWQSFNAKSLHNP